MENFAFRLVRVDLHRHPLAREFHLICYLPSSISLALYLTVLDLKFVPVTSRNEEERRERLSPDSGDFPRFADVKRNYA